MKKFEYKKDAITYTHYDTSKMEQKMELPMLEKKGLLGWELVAVTKIKDRPQEGWWENEYYFKREVLE